MTPSQVWRPMTWRDIPELVTLEERLFPDDAWQAPAWWAELAGRPRREYVVVSDGARVMAYAGLDHGGEVADIMTLGVVPEAQGRGLGARLVEHLLERAAAEGARHVMLEVRADNGPARSLYTAREFEIISTRHRYYQPGDVDALVMRRTTPRSGVWAGSTRMAGSATEASASASRDGDAPARGAGPHTEGAAS